MNSESADDPERGIRCVIQRADGRSMKKDGSESAEGPAENCAEDTEEERNDITDD